MLGTGVQARTHVDAIRRVRPITEIRVASRDPAKAAKFAAEVGGRAARSWEEAIRGADVVAATTHADEPVVRLEWLQPGTHVNSVGGDPRGSGEIDRAVVEGATVVVESRASSLADPPAGAPELAGLAPERVAELGEVVRRVRPGRDHPV